MRALWPRGLSVRGLCPIPRPSLPCAHTAAAVVPKGEVDGLSAPMEPHLRQLGLPTELQRGKIHVREETTLATEGRKLTANQAHLLKLFSIELAQFKVTLSPAFELK